MCGIFLTFVFNSPVPTSYNDIFSSFMKIKSRGPEYSSFNMIGKNLFIGFHRLAIMDKSAAGNQPFILSSPNRDIYLVCNGEIYNAEELKVTYELTPKSKSDCEIMILLYEKIGIDFVKLLDGEFAFIIVDKNNEDTLIFAGRDPIGVRPLFYSINCGSIDLCSEMKGLPFDKVEVFPPGTTMKFDKSSRLKFTSFYNYDYTPIMNIDMEQIYEEIRDRFTSAVKKRLITDRPFGCLLSGGLDSSMVCAVAKKFVDKFPCFTISFEGGEDLPYAVQVADYLELQHHIIYITPEEAIKAIKDTIYAIESYDITTVRASVMQYLIGKYISQHTDIKVLLVGELADEVEGGYLMFHKCPSESEFHDECVKLVKDVHRFDGLRTDRTMASFGLEVRLPYADPEFLDLYLSINPALRMITPSRPMEKYLFREAFKGYLPNKILYRPKAAFSDSISSNEHSWHNILSRYIDTLIPNDTFEKYRKSFEHNTPQTKEAYYYRCIYHTHFSEDKVIPYFWLPKWFGDVKDPSARNLDIYKK
jgi:asparagine synthase (glutamine-hydrolysing)